MLSGKMLSARISQSAAVAAGREPMDDKGVANCPSLPLIARGHVILTAERNGNDYVSHPPRRYNCICAIHAYLFTYKIFAICREYHADY